MLISDKMSQGVIEAWAYTATQKENFCLLWKFLWKFLSLLLKLVSESILPESIFLKKVNRAFSCFYHTLPLPTYTTTHFICNEKLSVEFNQTFFFVSPPLSPLSLPSFPSKEEQERWMQFRKLPCGRQSHTIGARYSLSLTAPTIGTTTCFPLGGLCSDFPGNML